MGIPWECPSCGNRGEVESRADLEHPQSDPRRARLRCQRCDTSFPVIAPPRRGGAPSAKWFVLLGPVDEAELRALVAADALGANPLVKRAGEARWMPYELEPRLAASPRRARQPTTATLAADPAGTSSTEDKPTAPAMPALSASFIPGSGEELDESAEEPGPEVPTVPLGAMPTPAPSPNKSADLFPPEALATLGAKSPTPRASASERAPAQAAGRSAAEDPRVCAEGASGPSAREDNEHSVVMDFEDIEEPEVALQTGSTQVDAAAPAALSSTGLTPLATGPVQPADYAETVGDSTIEHSVVLDLDSLEEGDSTTQTVETPMVAMSTATAQASTMQQLPGSDEPTMMEICTTDDVVWEETLVAASEPVARERWVIALVAALALLAGVGLWAAWERLGASSKLGSTPPRRVAAHSIVAGQGTGDYERDESVTPSGPLSASERKAPWASRRGERRARGRRYARPHRHARAYRRARRRARTSVLPPRSRSERRDEGDPGDRSPAGGAAEGDTGAGDKGDAEGKKDGALFEPEPVERRKLSPEEQKTALASHILRANKSSLKSCSLLSARRGETIEPHTRVSFALNVDHEGRAQRVKVKGKAPRQLLSCYRLVAKRWSLPAAGKPYAIEFVFLAR